MRSNTISEILLGTGILAVSAQGSPESQSISWGKCGDLDPDTNCSSCECGTLAVPLDYTNSSSTTVDLPLLRFPALEQPAKGSVLFNFGGPGVEARNTLGGLGPVLQKSTGGIYDLVAFDPRGTGENFTMTCIEDQELDMLNMNECIRLDPERSPNRLWAASTVLADRCKRTAADVGPFLGTAAVARDLMSVVDALDEDGMLRYWGMSYGTALGATVAAMFPDRIDRIVLDGNLNMHEYYNSFTDVEAWESADATFSAIWSQCIEAGADLCPLAKSYNDSTVLEDDVWNLLNSTISDPIVVAGANYSIVLDYNLLKQVYIAAIYGESEWPAATTITALLLNGETNNPDLYDLLSASLALSADKITAGYRLKTTNLGIRCADRVPRTSDPSELEPVLQRVRDVSSLFGDVMDAPAMQCAQWPFEPPERYSGPWADIRTHHPMLLLGNTFDPLTPLKSAYNTSAAFPGSAVLEIDVYGHASLAAVSECVDTALQAYFVNGTLPPEKTRCENEMAPYRAQGE